MHEFGCGHDRYSMLCHSLTNTTEAIDANLASRHRDRLADGDVVDRGCHVRIRFIETGVKRDMDD